MRKQLSLILLILLSFAMLVNAEPITVSLKSPTDNSVITEYAQAFIFDFTQDPADILNCSLLVNNEVKGFRNSLIMRFNNKISLNLEAGTYVWYISCLDKSLNEINSVTRTFTVDVGSEVKEGYQTLYNSDGSRSYVLTIAPGQKQVTLPAMKGGEDIQIKFGGKTYYVDVIKMGNDINTTFVEVRDRSSGKTHRMLTPSTIQLDFNNDKTNDIALTLNNVERGVNAYFSVTPYPAAPPAEVPEQTPAQPSETPEETPVTQPGEQPPQETPEEKPQDEPSGPEIIYEEEEDKDWNNWLIPAAIIILVVLVLVILLSSSKAKKSGKKAEKKDEPEQQPIPQEKFEIIKSTGRKK